MNKNFSKTSATRRGSLAGDILFWCKLNPLAVYWANVTQTIRDQTEKSRIRETSNLLTNADRRTDTILERLRDLSEKKLKN